MKCQTVRKHLDFDCPFMKETGCELPNGCTEATLECLGTHESGITKGECNKVILLPDNENTSQQIFYCSAYANPELKWKLGKCPLSSNFVIESEEKKKINALKASKRKAKGKST